MVYFKDAQTYLQQSTLLLEARPTSTRITTRYTLSRPAPSTATTSTPSADAAPPKPRGILVLKTYDPVSGTCLKYKTDKAAEVGRLVAGMGRCARVMAGVPQVKEDEEEEEADGEGGNRDREGEGKEGQEAKKVAQKETVVPVPAAGKGKVPDGGAGGGGGGGGKGKKKKGKK